MSKDVPYEVDSLLIHDAFLRRLAGRIADPSSADDVVQNAWLTALRRAPREAAAAKAWLAKVVRSFAAMDFRVRDRDRRREIAVARRDGAPTAEEIVEREAVRQEVVGALLALDAVYRDALLLRFERDLPPRKIAAALGIATETARSRVRRGLELLRKELVERRGDRRLRLALGLLLRPGPSAALSPFAIGLLATAATIAAVVVVAVFLRSTDMADRRQSASATHASAASPAASIEPTGASVGGVARRPFTEPSFRIVAEEETDSVFPCAEPLDAEGRPAVVATRVVDLLTGRTAADAVVSLEEESLAPIGAAPAPILTTIADADGYVRLRVEDLHDRPFGWFISAPGRAVVADFASRPECPVVLRPPSARTVLAVDTFGRPLPGLRFDLVMGCGHHAVRRRFETDADGRTTVDGLGPDGVHLWPVDARVATDEIDVEPTDAADPAPVLAILAPSREIRGTVLRNGAPVPDVYVGTPHRHRGPWAKTGADGRFTLWGAPYGESLLVRSVLSPAAPGSPFGTTQDLGDMARPPAGREGAIELSRRGVSPTEASVTVSVRCADASGSPLADVALCAYGDGGDVARAVTGADGVARLPLFRGRYEITTDDPFSAADVLPFVFQATASDSSPPVVPALAVPRRRIRVLVPGDRSEARARLATADGIRELDDDERQGRKGVPLPPEGPVAVVVEQDDLRTVLRLDEARDRGTETPITIPPPPKKAAEPLPTLTEAVVVVDAEGRAIADAEFAFAEGDGAVVVRTGADGRGFRNGPPPRPGVAFAVRADGHAPYFSRCDTGGPQRVSLPAGVVVAEARNEDGLPLLQTTVLIDGEPIYVRGEPALVATLRGLGPGRHEAVFAAPGRVARRVTFDLDDGATARLTVVLRKTN